MSSDTTAFLAGCAITGVAAVLLLRGGILDAAPRGNPTAPSPPVTLSTPSFPGSNSDPTSQNWQLERELVQQRSIAEDLKNQIVRQQEATNDLKTAIAQQQSDTDKILTQLQLRLEEQQRTIDAMTVQQQISTADRFRSTEQLRLTEQSRLATSSDQPRTQSTILWAVGITIIVLAVGGGIILLVLVVLLFQSQRRYPRPVHVIHPMPPPYVFPEQALLPPGPRTRRTNQIEIYED